MKYLLILFTTLGCTALLKEVKMAPEKIQPLREISVYHKNCIVSERYMQDGKIKGRVVRMLKRCPFNEQVFSCFSLDEFSKIENYIEYLYERN